MNARRSVGVFRIVSAMVSLAVVLPFVVPSLARAAQAEGQRLLQQLTEGARKEGVLDLMITSSQTEKGAKELTDAFKRRFGLDIRVNADVSGQESQKFNQAVAETKSGIPATFDLMQAEPPNVLNLMGVGGVEPVVNWEALLAEIAPEAFKAKDRVSPPGLAGSAFVWATRISALLYNPRLISEQELPKTWREMGNPRFAGAYSVTPWITVPTMCMLKYEKDECLEIVRSWGRNKRHVLTETAGTQRMLLGEFKFLIAHTHNYSEEKAKDPNAVIGQGFFEDLTPVRQAMYVVRRGARHPNAAKLFALWVTGAEADLIFEKHSFYENLALGTGTITRMTLQKLNERNIKPVTFFDSSQNLEKFRWLQTEEGRKYSRAIAVAQADGK